MLLITVFYGNYIRTRLFMSKHTPGAKMYYFIFTYFLR